MGRINERQVEWDGVKEAANLRKHGVTFVEATSVFQDPLSATHPDPDHSVGEERFITVGVSSRGRLLALAHTDRGDMIRIINCRLATRRERKNHEEKG